MRPRSCRTSTPPCSPQMRTWRVETSRRSTIVLPVRPPPQRRKIGPVGALGMEIRPRPSLYQVRRRAPVPAEDELAQRLSRSRSEIALSEFLRHDARIGGIADRNAGQWLHVV